MERGKGKKRRGKKKKKILSSFFRPFPVWGFLEEKLMGKINRKIEGKLNEKIEEGKIERRVG